ncbi:MAG: tetratricopeptide repeat protein, partial [candidate division Zixibacteria bacterium]|nr:tetratricopeptide repeat protein [candidate division Zixibacteria bacterium]
MTEKTKTDTVIDWIKNNKVLSILIVIGIIIIAVGNLTDALQKIKNLVSPSEPPTPVVKVQFPDEEPQRCELDILPKKPFKYENSTKILIAAFQGENPEDKKFGKNISMVVDEKLEEFREDSLKLAGEDIEVLKLDCYIEDHDKARQILDTLGADIFVWGNNFCSTKSELAKFCPKATLTKRISPIEARGKWNPEIRQLQITDLDLPSLTAEKPYQLLNFIFGLHFYLRDKFKEAGVYFEKAGDEIYRKEKGIEYVYHYLAYTYQFLSKNDKALQYYEKSLQIFEDLGDRKNEGVTLNNIGEIYRGWGKYNEALEYYRMDLKITQELEDRQGEGVSLNNIGLVYHAWGKYDQAIEYHSKSLKIMEEVGDRQGEGVILNNIGSVYHARGKYDQAVEYYKKSLKITEEIKDRNQEAVTLNNIGEIYRAWGKYDQAIEY